MTYNEALIRWGGQFPVSLWNVMFFIKSFYDDTLTFGLGKHGTETKLRPAQFLINNNKCNRQPFNCSTSKNLSSFSTRLWMLARGEGICSNSFIFPMRGHIILIRWKLWMRKSGPKMNQTYEESYTQFISVLFSLMKVLKSNKRRKLAETCTLHSPNWNPNFISPQFIYRYLDIYTIPIKRTLGKTRKCFPASAKILSFVWSFCMNIYILAFFLLSMYIM